MRLRTADDRRRPRLFTWNDLLGSFPGLIGVKTGHTGAAGWSQVAAVRRNGVMLYATVLGGPTRAQRNEDLRELLAWGVSRYRLVRAIDAGRTYATAPTGYGRPPVRLVAPKDRLRIVRVGRPLVERVIAPTAVELPVRSGQRLGEVRVYAGGKLIARSPLVAARGIDEPGLWGRASWYAGRTSTNWGAPHVIVTVTMNAALDRTLTVPNFQRAIATARAAC